MLHFHEFTFVFFFLLFFADGNLQEVKCNNHPDRPVPVPGAPAAGPDGGRAGEADHHVRTERRDRGRWSFMAYFRKGCVAGLIRPPGRLIGL